MAVDKSKLEQIVTPKNGTSTPRAFRYDQNSGEIIYTVGLGDTRDKILEKIGQIAARNGKLINDSEIPERLVKGQKLRIQTLSVGEECRISYNQDSVTLSDESEKYSGPLYDPLPQPTTRLEARYSYRDIIDDKDNKDKETAIKQRRSDYARQIFDQLFAQGFIKADVKFETWWGFGGIGKEMTKLIGDDDLDGYFDFDATELYSLLNKEKVLQNTDKNSFKLSLDGTNTRYFKEEFGNKIVLSYIDKGGSLPWEDRFKLKSRAVTNLRRFEKAAEEDKKTVESLQQVLIDQKVKKMPLGEFRVYLNKKYGNKLCGNPTLQDELASEIRQYVQANFAHSMETGENGKPIEIGVEDEFILTPENVEYLSVDSFGRHRADCGIYAQAFQICFSAAGLKTEYFGSHMPIGRGGSGHVQVVGYLPGGDFMLVNNNRELGIYAFEYSPKNSQYAVREEQKNDREFHGAVALKIYPGLKTQKEVAEKIKQDSSHNITVASLQGALIQCQNLLGDYRFLAETDTEKIVSDVMNGAEDPRSPQYGAFKNLSGKYYPEKTKKLLIILHLANIEEMQQMLEDAKAEIENIPPQECRLTLTYYEGRQEKTKKLVGPKEISDFIAKKEAEIARYRKAIDAHIKKLEAMGA